MVRMDLEQKIHDSSGAMSMEAALLQLVQKLDEGQQLLQQQVQ